MFRQPTEKCTHIAEWLMIATQDLFEPAALRISAEIETHYRDAVETHLGEGETAGLAEMRALEELGDPTDAARRFRWKHLTKKETKMIEGLRKRVDKSPKNQFLAEIFICALVGGFVAMVQGWSTSLLMFWLFPLEWLGRFIAKHSPENFIASRLLLLQVLFGFLGDGVIVAAWAFSTQSCGWNILFSCCFVIFAIQQVRWILIWQKVRRNEGSSESFSGSNLTGAN